MAASYPGTVKTFTTKEDGTFVYAQHVNAVQDEVVAIQTVLGTSPAGASATVKDRIAAVETGKAASVHSHTDYVEKATATAKGDLFVATAAGTIARLPSGTDGRALLADSTAAEGVAWSELSTEQTTEFGKTGTLTVAVGKGRWVAPFAVTLLGVRAVVGTPPSGASLIVDLNKAAAGTPGTLSTTYTTQANRPTIASGAYASSETVPDVTALAAGDHLQVDVDQVGSTAAGADLTVIVRFKKA